MTAYAIIAAVAQIWGISKVDLLGNNRSARLSGARFMLYAALANLLGLSRREIGQRVGNRDHSTVSHGIAEFEAQLATDTMLDMRWHELHKRLGVPLADEPRELPPVEPPPEPILRLIIEVLPGGDIQIPALLDYLRRATV